MLSVILNFLTWLIEWPPNFSILKVCFSLWVFLLLNEFYCKFIVVQQSSQPNFIAFPSKIPSSSPYLQPVSFGNHKFFKVCESVSVLQRSSLCPFFQILHVNDSIWCWYLSSWLTSLSMIISRFIHVAKNAGVLFHFNGWVIFHCVYLPHLLYPLLEMDI